MKKGTVIRINRGGKPSDFVVTETIAEGGKSQAAKVRSDGEDLFMKLFLSPKYPDPSASSDPNRLRKLQEGCQRFERRHTEIMRRLREPILFGGNLVKPLDFFRAKNSYYKLYPLMNAERSTVISGEAPPARELFAKTFLASLRELHARDIVHSDLKPDNVLVNRMPAGPVAKLIDFDDAYFSGDPPERALGGDEVYFSPELAQHHAGTSKDPDLLTVKSDIFAAGLVLHRVLSGQLPDVTGASGESHAERVLAGGRIEMAPLAGMSREFRAALRQTVALRPADRPSVDELLDALGVRQDPPKAPAAAEPAPKPLIVSGIEIKSSFGTRLNRNAPRSGRPSITRESDR